VGLKCVLQRILSENADTSSTAVLCMWAVGSGLWAVGCAGTINKLKEVVVR
jgi:hypothetical protein